MARGGGGVIVFMKEGLICEEAKSDTWNDIEVIVFKVLFLQSTLVCACIYRPPEPGECYNADQFLICGDFNYSKIDWNNHDIPTAARDEQIKEQSISTFKKKIGMLFHERWL